MSRVTHMRALIVLVGGFFAALAFAKPGADLDKVSLQEISERIAPVSTVCTVGDDCADAAGVVASASSGPRSGDAVFNKYCTACHTSGLLGAPKKGDLAAWQEKETAAGGFSKLLANSISGIKSMPPKGTCSDCSDEELSKTIEYMSGLKP